MEVRKFFKRLFLLWCLVLTGLSAPASAKEKTLECRCKPYLPSSLQLSLSKDLAAIGSHSPSSQGNSVEEGLELHKHHRSRILADQNIPMECREWVANELGYGPLARGFQLQLGYLGTQKGSVFQSNPSIDKGDDLLLYFTLARKAWTQTPCPYPYSGSETDNAAYYACLEKGQSITKKAFKTALNQGTELDVASKINVLLRTPHVSESDVRVMRAFESIVDSRNFKEAQFKMSQFSKRADEEEVIHLITMLGDHMLRGYDLSRANPAHPASEGIVSEDQLLEAMSYNLNTQGHHIEDSKSPRKRAGVCRDIAFFQAKLLDSAGMKAYIIGYGSNPSSHATIIAQSNKKEDLLYRVNYGILNQRRGVDGARAIYQGDEGGIPDLSSTYIIFDSNGRQIQAVQSEMGKLLAEATGFGVRDFDPLARKESRLNSARQVLPTTKSIENSIQAFVGDDGNASQYAGLSTTHKWDLNPHFPGKAGSAIALRSDSALNTQNQTGDTRNWVLYGQFEQSAQTRELLLKENLKLQLKTTLQGYGDLHFQVTPDRKPNRNGGSKGTIMLKNQAILKAKLDSATESETELSLTLMPGMADNRESKLSPLDWAYEPTYITLREKLTRELASGKKVFLEGLLVGNRMGTRGSLEAGVLTDRVGASLTYSGALGILPDEPSLLQESTLQRVRGSLRYRLRPGMDLGLEIQWVDSELPASTEGSSGQLFPAHLSGSAFVGGTLP